MPKKTTAIIVLLGLLWVSTISPVFAQNQSIDPSLLPSGPQTPAPNQSILPQSIDPILIKGVSNSGASLNNLLDKSQECRIGPQFENLVGYLASNILWQGGFLLLDMVTSSLKESKIKIPLIAEFNFPVEPFDQTINFLRDKWLKALYWGFASTFANIILGGFIYEAIDFNLSLDTSHPIIEFGYGTSLGLTNIALVIAVILIAFGVMLRKQGVGTTKILWRVIIAALLVNFTMLFASVVLNAGTKLTEVMVRVTQPCPAVIATQFSAYNLHGSIKDLAKTTVEDTTLDPTEALKLGFNLDAISKLFSAPLEAVTKAVSIDYISLLAASIISTLGALTFLTLFIFLIVRYGMILILLAISPLIWIGFVFRGVSGELGQAGDIWHKWLNNFLKWVFFGPIIVFFLALASNYVVAITNGDIVSAGAVSTIGHLVVIIVLSLGGIYTTNKMSAVGAGLVMTGVGRGLGWFSQSSQKFFRGRQSSALARAERMKEEYGKDSKEAKRAQRTANVYGRISEGAQIEPTLTSMLSQTGLKIPEQKPVTIKSEIKRREEELKDTEADGLADLVTKGGVPNSKRVAALDMLAAKGKVSKIKNVGLVMNDEMKSLMKAQGKDFSNVEKGFGMSLSTYKAIKTGNQEEAIKEMDKFMKGFSKNDFKKFPAANILNKFKEKDPFLGLNKENFEMLKLSTAKALANNPGDINKIAPQIKGKDYDEFLGAIIEYGLKDAKKSIEKVFDAQTNIPLVNIKIEDAKKDLIKYKIKTFEEPITQEIIDDIKKNPSKIEDYNKPLYNALKRTLAHRETGVPLEIEIEEKKD